MWVLSTQMEFNLYLTVGASSESCFIKSGFVEVFHSPRQYGYEDVWMDEQQQQQQHLGNEFFLVHVFN